MKARIKETNDVLGICNVWQYTKSMKSIPVWAARKFYDIEGKLTNGKLTCINSDGKLSTLRETDWLIQLKIGAQYVIAVITDGEFKKCFDLLPEDREPGLE